MDVAASEFWVPEKQVYDLDFKTANNDGSNLVNSAALTNLYQQLVKEYPIVSIEDPFDQDDWAGYGNMNALIGKTV